MTTELSGIHNVRLFTYEELEHATDGFSDTNKIGEGGFGPVYKVLFHNHSVKTDKYHLLCPLSRFIITLGNLASLFRHDSKVGSMQQRKFFRLNQAKGLVNS